MLTRATLGQIQVYAERAKEDDLGDDEMPSQAVLKGMSLLLDSACKETFSAFELDLHESRKMRRAVATLTNGPRTCGGFTP